MHLIFLSFNEKHDETPCKRLLQYFFIEAEKRLSVSQGSLEGKKIFQGYKSKVVFL